MQRSMPISISHDLVSNEWDTQPHPPNWTFCEPFPSSSREFDKAVIRVPELDVLRTFPVVMPRVL